MMRTASVSRTLNGYVPNQNERLTWATGALLLLWRFDSFLIFDAAKCQHFQTNYRKIHFQNFVLFHLLDDKFLGAPLENPWSGNWEQPRSWTELCVGGWDHSNPFYAMEEAKNPLVSGKPKKPRRDTGGLVGGAASIKKWVFFWENSRMRVFRRNCVPAAGI